MTGPEHYREAERLLIGIASPHATDEGIRRALAAAQVHATLAQAAAAALSAGDGSMMSTPDYEAWEAVVSAAPAVTP